MGGKKKTENKPRSPSRKEAEEGWSLHSSWPPAPSISATLFEKGSFHFYRKSYSIVQHRAAMAFPSCMDLFDDPEALGKLMP